MPFRYFWSICAPTLWVALLAGPVDCPAATPATWLTGPELARKLAEPATFSWTNAPAERVLKNLSESQRVAILLDRRIDPQHQVTLATSDAPLGKVLGELASRLNASYCQFGPVAYIGPAKIADKLRTLAALRLADVKRLDKQRVRELLRLRSWSWDDLAEPRQLAADLAQQAGVELLDDGRIPHDLWRAADLPPVSWIDRVTLLAAQFDLTFRLEDAGRRLRLTPLPEHVAIARTYRVGGNAKARSCPLGSAIARGAGDGRRQRNPAGRTTGRSRTGRAAIPVAAEAAVDRHSGRAAVSVRGRKYGA